MTKVLKVVLCAGLVLLWIGNAKAYRFEGQETQITTNPSDQMDPSVSGAVVVYTDVRNGNADIYMYDVETGVETQITSDAGDQYFNDIDGDRVVYTDYTVGGGDVMVYTISTGQITNVTDHPAEQRNPAISGDWVVFEDDRNGDFDIWAKNVVTGQEVQLSSSAGHERNPDIDGTIVVWEDRRSGTDYDVYMRDINGGPEVLVGGGQYNQWYPHVDGDIIVFSSEIDVYNNRGDIIGYRISTGEKFNVTSGPAWERIPVVSGDYVAFERLDEANGDIDIWLYSMSLGQEVLATENQANQYLQALDGNRLVYTDDRAGNLDIYMFEFVFDEPPPQGQGCDDPSAVAVFGPKTYVRGHGKPELIVNGFAGQNLSGKGYICIVNGDGDSSRVTSAIVVFNGEQVAGPGDFGEDVGSLQIPVDIKDANIIGVQLRGKPGSRFTLRVIEETASEDAVIITCATAPAKSLSLIVMAMFLTLLWRRRG